MRIPHTFPFGGVPGMGDNLAVKVSYRLGSRNCQLEVRVSVMR